MNIRTRQMEDFEKKWGKVCKHCGKRQGTFATSKGAEGGKPSVCECDENK